jgi:diguanylate cyclase (GGDEF)-like protein
VDSRKILFLNGKTNASEKLTPLLKQQKCDISAIEGGLTGVNAIYKEKPDLIFLDSSISDIPVYQICKLIRSDSEYKDTPVIVTGESERERRSIFNISKVAVEYLNLSEDLDKINQQIKKILSKHKKVFTVSKTHKTIEDLNRIIRDISSHYYQVKRLNIEELDKLFEQIISKFTTILNSEIGSLMLVDEESGHLYIKAAKGLKEDIITKTKIRIGEGISGQVVEKDSPILVGDIEEDTRFSKTNDKRYYTKSFLSAPLRIGSVRGVININNKSTKEPYDERDLILMALLINQIHLAQENSRFFTELKSKKEETVNLKTDRDILKKINNLLDKELNESEVSCQINKILSSDLGYEQTINAVIELIESSIDYHFCGLLILDSAQEAELMVSIKYPATEYDLAAFKSKTIDAYYELSGYKIILEKVSLNRTNGPAILASEKEREKDVINSFYCLPLNIKNKNLGLLAVSHSESNAFGPEEKKFISIISDESSIAINNAALHKKIKNLSITDGLTGLYCYRFFQSKLDEELTRAQRYQEPLSLVMIDIDGFKSVNDSHGHLAGDKILREISAILKSFCREVDIVCRYGGEEFIIILPETDKEGGFYLAERLRKAIKDREFKSPKNEPIRLTVSCGVASFPDSAKKKDELVKKADDALYRSKDEGKNKTSLIDL